MFPACGVLIHHRAPFPAAGPKQRAICLLFCSVIAAAVVGLHSVDAFTCPATCNCGSASANCIANAAADGGATATCAECTGMAAVPTLTPDTSALYLWSSPSLAPVIGATGFQFPSTWASLKSL